MVAIARRRRFAAMNGPGTQRGKWLKARQIDSCITAPKSLAHPWVPPLNGWRTVKFHRGWAHLSQRLWQALSRNLPALGSLDVRKRASAPLFGWAAQRIHSRIFALMIITS